MEHPQRICRHCRTTIERTFVGWFAVDRSGVRLSQTLGCAANPTAHLPSRVHVPAAVIRLERPLALAGRAG